MNIFNSRFVLPDGHRYAPSEAREFYELELKMLPGNIGKGLFAKVPIKKGAVIATDGGVIVNSLSDVPEDKDYYMVQEEQIFLLPQNYHDPENICYTSHSCSPNMGRIGGLVYVAKKDIAAGEEITMDYAPTMAGHPGWKLECECRQPNCRRLISWEDWLNPEIAHELWPEWAPHIQKRIIELGILR